MAVQNPFFGKREPESFQPRSSTTSGSVLGGSGVGSASSAQPTAPVAPKPSSASDSSGSKLTVGPNIKLKGVEITDCDTLVVEGTVEATMDSRVIQISENGAFKGSAEIDIAEIHGEFNGTLTVRQKLVIYSTGKVNGKIRYGKLVVEEGGQLAGEIEAGFSASSSSSSSSSSHLQRGAAPLRTDPVAALAA
ncbi:cell shape determination protein CcmA [Acidovorax sp. HMWF029]|uniref:bactofilin family protein n=1 Tax=unclassified Acidovorax TaxID=2684926 RepID=UPI000D3A6475|nr:MULTISPECIES: polymer-forming cytoskeletal protein [unclassified Acidovorax]MDH4417784.1 polymer-forming cytoskeletal protein [Acidovorax sp.]PTT18268.1 cell shape determination protein CcmA [Acidovorax sp. HMWF029]